MVDYSASGLPSYEETFLSSNASTMYSTPDDTSLGKIKSKKKGDKANDLLLMQDTTQVSQYQAPNAHFQVVDLTDCERLGPPIPVTTSKAKISSPYIGGKDEASDFLVTNKHILRGYRIGYTTWGRTFCSLFELHNETVNVWTHFLGFIVCMVCFAIMSFSQKKDDASLLQSAKHLMYLIQGDEEGQNFEMPSFDFGYLESQKAEFNVFMATLEQMLQLDQTSSSSESPQPSFWLLDYKRAEAVSTWPLIAYLITAAFCLGCSTTCHLCYVKSPRISKVVSNLDYWGIALLFLGTTYPFISYKYACGRYIFWRYIFVTIITAMTVACMVLTVKTAFIKPLPRAILFTSFGVSVLIPTVGLTLWKDPEYTLEPKLEPYTWTVLTYVIGMIIYVTKVPERYSKTGTFDFIGSSHQIFHCLVLVGIAVTFYNSYQVYLERLNFTCPDR